MNHHYDIIIIGTGAGGGTMARALSETSARILILERGDFVPQEEENWDPEAVWKHLRYRAREQWLDDRGREFTPYTHYGVGGNTKFWGSVLYRLRREDFQAVEHMDGLSPAWPIDYDTLAPYYDRAEHLFHVRGADGADPTEPPARPIRTSRFRTLPKWPRSSRSCASRGCIRLRCRSGCSGLAKTDGCILCNTCNSFVCKLHAKSEADVCCVRPALARPNVTLWTNATRDAAAHRSDRAPCRGRRRDRDGEPSASMRRWSSCRAARSTRRRCCCDRRRQAPGRASRIPRGWSAAATWRTWRR